jgi:hypothetical protein
MSQVPDLVYPNGSAQGLRLDMEATAQAIVSLFSGNDEPAAAVRRPFMLWVDEDGAPAALYTRNAANTLWIKVWEYGASTLTLFSGGAPVPQLTAANVWQASQFVRVVGAAGELEAGSNLTAGVPGALLVAGDNAAGVKKVLLRWDAAWTNNAVGLEAASGRLQLLTAGGLIDILTALGTAITLPGSLNALGGVSINGIAVPSLIGTEVGLLREHSTWSGAAKTTDGVTAGTKITYTGAGPTTLTIRRRTQHQFIGVEVTGGGTVTMQSDAAPFRVTPIGGLSLGPDGFAIIRWRDADLDLQKVKITGDNV